LLWIVQPLYLQPIHHGKQHDDQIFGGISLRILLRACAPPPVEFEINKNGTSCSLAPSLRLSNYSAAIASAIAPGTPERVPNPGGTMS
jgi:hypothetical protein